MNINEHSAPTNVLLFFYKTSVFLYEIEQIVAYIFYI